jgi:HAD superfamily hydrolase (TIGR01484 family)
MTDIKLIVTDMDGTFLNSNYEVSPDFTEIYTELKRRNILFVPASGRQMPGITKYFEEIEHEIGFIAENGGYVVYQGQELFADKMEHSHISEIIKAVREISGARAVLSAKKYAYYETEDQNFVDFFTRYYTKNKKMKDLTEMVDDSAFKIAIYHPEGSEKNLYPFLKHFEKYGMEVVVSGELYYELLAKKEEINDEKVALVRLEQLYPLDNLRINEILEKYNNRKEFVWAQEEPENMGAWTFMLRNFRNQNIQVISPVSSGTPAPGTHKKFDKNQKGVINGVFGLSAEDAKLIKPVTTIND